MVNTDSPPVPDPTVLTTEQLIRGLKGERDYADGQLAVLQERLNGIDRATALLSETVNRTPTEIQKEVKHLRELMNSQLGATQKVVDEQFKGVATQFKERDTRQERESRDGEIRVNAAFAAQKEAASEQNKSNLLAISKSEAGTAENISKLNELFTTSIKSVTEKIEDIKKTLEGLALRINAIETTKQTTTETRVDARANLGQQIMMGGLILGGAQIITAIILALVFR